MITQRLTAWNGYIALSCILLLVLSIQWLIATVNADEMLEGSHGIDSCKEIIIRDDDVQEVTPALEWLSDLAERKDVKITFAVIPRKLLDDQELINYLRSLDQNRFEMATHGFAHEQFMGLPYLRQYELIDRGTKAMVLALHERPYSFVPPYNLADLNTTRALIALGYNSISGNATTTDITNESDFDSFPALIEWEIQWEPKVIHIGLRTFEGEFDEQYNSSNKNIIILLHDETFMSDSGNLNTTLTDSFEKAIDYMKTRCVKFVTIKEAYRLHHNQSH